MKKVKEVSDSKQAYLDAKKAQKEARQREKEFANLEKRLKTLEQEKVENERQLHDACLERDTGKIKTLGQRCKEIYDEIETAYQEMEGLMD